MFSKSTNLHPLVSYIRNWEAFNAIDRKLFHIFMLKLLGACISTMLLISYVTW